MASLEHVDTFVNKLSWTERRRAVLLREEWKGLLWEWLEGYLMVLVGC